jgi:hypothetical protein
VKSNNLIKIKEGYRDYQTIELGFKPQRIPAGTISRRSLIIIRLWPALGFEQASE